MPCAFERGDEAGGVCRTGVESLNDPVRRSVLPLGTLQVYVQRVSPQKTPMVVGKLLDLDCSEDFIRQLLNSVGHQCPVDELVEQVR